MPRKPSRPRRWSDEALSSVTDESLWCRTERHQWQWLRDSLSDDRSEFVRTLHCPRCGVEKSKTISLRTFVVTQSRMTYPKGYLVTGGRLDQSEVYRAQIDRLHLGGLPSSD